MTARRRQACARAPKRCRPCFRRSRRADGGKELSEKLTMRRSQRLIAAAVLVSLSTVLAGCSDSLSNWDPTDMLDFLDTKKKIPGDPKPVFPEGVPGLEQGVPKELYKGSAQERIDQQNAQAAAAASAPAGAPTSKQAKSKSKQPAAADAASGEDGGANAAPPAPKPKKI